MGLKTWFDRVRRFARRAATDVGGNVAMLFGLAMPVLILMTFGGVDIHRLTTVRVNLQDALDAATLAAARSPYTSDADLKRIGLAALKANLERYDGIHLDEDAVTFTLDDDVVVGDATVNVDTLVANVVLPPYGQMLDNTIPVGGHSEVDRSSRNIEVALVLDITGSMDEGTRMADLKKAAVDLIDLVVQPVQTPYYSKVALVPYSNAVNPGSAYVNQVRGSIKTSTNVTGAAISLMGTAKTITAASKGNPIVITSNAHGFADNDVVWITGATGMTQLNNKPYKINWLSVNTFELWTMGGKRVDGSKYNTYSGTAGRVQKCQNNDCSIIITSANHGLSNNDYVYFTDVGGLRDAGSSTTSVVNDKAFLVGNVTTNTFTIEPPDGQSITAYTSGGKAWCAQPGCTWYAFENVNGDLNAHKFTPCVTERGGDEAATDVQPTGASSWVGRHYPNTGGTCLGATIMPLSTDKEALKAKINGLQPSGTTAGQIGIGWGWYMVSPNFNALWPSNGAGNYDIRRTLKAVVIMTDGEFNTPYCKGVVPDSWGGGSINSANRIDCTDDGVSEYKDPFAHSADICTAMKRQGVIVYTVGFQIEAGGDAAELLEGCASSRDKFFMPSSGGDLSEAFAAIGRDITKLRISK